MTFRIFVGIITVEVRFIHCRSCLVLLGIPYGNHSSLMFLTHLGPKGNVVIGAISITHSFTCLDLN